MTDNIYNMKEYGHIFIFSVLKLDKSKEIISSIIFPARVTIKASQARDHIDLRFHR